MYSTYMLNLRSISLHLGQNLNIFAIKQCSVTVHGVKELFKAIEGPLNGCTLQGAL